LHADDVPQTVHLFIEMETVEQRAFNVDLTCAAEVPYVDRERRPPESVPNSVETPQMDLELPNEVRVLAERIGLALFKGTF
jgi:hypothetical protein